MKKVVHLLVVSIGLVTVRAESIHVMMMEATCKIVGPGSTGTGFIIGKPGAKIPGGHYFTLITAEHVLTNCQGDFATMVFRTRKLE